MNAPTLKTLPIKKIKPYWRNPRENHAAVEKVKKSIQEFGYNQLIAVDQKYVIIAGHTRYRALEELGWKEIPVHVLDLDEKQAKAYRIIDNKTAEFAKWDDAGLLVELRELGDVGLMQDFFTEDLASMLGKHVGVDGIKDVTADDVVGKSDELRQRFGGKSAAYNKSEKEIACPHCHEVFYITGS